MRSGGGAQFLCVNPAIPHNFLYLAERRSNVGALFYNHDELREINVPPLTAAYCNARPEMLRRTIQQIWLDCARSSRAKWKCARDSNFNCSLCLRGGATLMPRKLQF